MDLYGFPCPKNPSGGWQRVGNGDYGNSTPVSSFPSSTFPHVADRDSERKERSNCRACHLLTCPAPLGGALVSGQTNRISGSATRRVPERDAAVRHTLPVPVSVEVSSDPKGQHFLLQFRVRLEWGYFVLFEIGPG